MGKYDFSGWATRINIKCADGRTIMKDAFKHNDGAKVPLVWMHQHTRAEDVLGHALLEHREEGVYAYCTFNETESGKVAKELVRHGDIGSLSIFANNLREQMGNVIHGNIREVSLVLAGANRGAIIEDVMCHGEDSSMELSAEICTTEEGSIELYHAESGVSKGEEKVTDETKKNEQPSNDKTVGDILNSFTEEQMVVVEALIGDAIEKTKAENNNGGNEEMKHNLFEGENNNGAVLTHSDEMAIMELAKSRNCGSFQQALKTYAEEHLAHGFEDYDELFPDHQWVKPGAPELITNDYTWVERVLNKVHKSPISRIRMRHNDLREQDIRAMGYEKATEKKLIGSMKLVNRSFDPQTVYVKDKIERDDMIDITDFDVVAYQKNIMKRALHQELATAILIGDGRQDGEEGKIYDKHIQPIWTDDELFTIHADVDIATAKAELQGSATGANFGDNYIYAEAIITAALYAREKYKGSGSLDFYCTPHLLNVMLLARDMNGRRIYESKSDLAAALNVSEIHTIEQFENKIRTTDDGDKKKLLGLFVNLSDYQVGSTKGGQITNFEDFDIDFNHYKYLMETRCSGALTKVFSAIALEEPVISG